MAATRRAGVKVELRFKVEKNKCEALIAPAPQMDVKTNEGGGRVPITDRPLSIRVQISDKTAGFNAGEVKGAVALANCPGGCLLRRMPRFPGNLRGGMKWPRTDQHGVPRPTGGRGGLSNGRRQVAAGAPDLCGSFPATAG